MIASVAVVAVVMSAAAPPPASPYELLAAGQSIPLQPRSLDVQPRSIVPESVTEDYTVYLENGFVIDGPLGSPDPQPTDAPFGAEVAVIADPDAQTHPSIAGEPSGSVLYAAYTDQTTPTNRDVYVARSTNGGASWTAVALATAAYNEFDPRVVVHGSRVFVFFSMDDAAVPRAYRYAVSANQGTSYAVNTINFGGGGPFRDMRNPDASSASGQWLYVTYEMDCDVASLCNGVTAQGFFTTLFDANGALIPNPHTIYFPFGIDIWEPSIVSNAAGLTMVVGDIDAGDPGIGGPPGSHDLVWLNSTTGQNTPASWGQAFITGFFSTDRVRIDSFGYGPNYVFAYQFINSAQGFPNHAIFDLYTQDSGAAYTLDLLAGVSGTEFKDPAGFASVPIMHVTYYMGGDLGYAFSLDASTTWSAPYKVNSNSGSVQDAIRSNDVTYAGKVRVCWQDNRPGNLEIFCSGFSGWSFYVFDRNPRQGTLDLDGPSATPVPFAQLWPVGDNHNIVAPTPDLGPPGVRYVFSQWSDANTNPARAITVGAADTVLIANYNTEYFLDISAPVGTVSPASGWFAAGATVSILWTPPAPGPGVRYTFNGWTGSGPGSYTGLSNPVDIIMNGPITEIADAVREFQVTLDTSPTGLTLTIDGTNWATPRQEWWVDGSSHTVTAISPQQPNPPLERYVFARWADGTLTPTRSITATASQTYTANYNLEYSVTVTSNPVGRTVSVDGSPAATPLTFWWAQNSVHIVDAPSPQTVGVDTRYLYQSWSDGGAQSHTVTATGPLTLTATFSTEFRCILDTSPAGLNLLIDGTSLPAPQTLWWAQGSTHTAEFQTITLTPDSRRVFAQWSDGNLNNPRTFSVSGPCNVTAQTAVEFRYILDTNPTGLNILIDSVSMPTPQTVWWRQGTTHTIEFRTIVQPDVQLVFVQWNDGSTVNPRTFTNVNAGGNYVADVIAQYRYIFDTSPAGLDLLVDSVTCTAPCTFWWNFGSTHTVEFPTIAINPTTRRAFLQWNDSNPNNPRTFASVSGPGRFTSQTVLEYLWSLDTSPTGLNLLVDGAPCSAPCLVWFAQGSTHTAEFPSPQTVGVDARRVFAQWSDGNGNNPRTFTGVSGPQTLSVQTFAEYRVQFTGTPTGLGISISVGGTTIVLPDFVWIRDGTTTLDAMSPQAGPTDTRYMFVRWGDGNTNGVRTVTVGGPTTYSVVFKVQYFLTIDPTSPLPITCSVADCWYDDGTTATVSLSAGIYESPIVPGTRLVFAEWTVDGAPSGTAFALSSPIAMTGPKSVSNEWTAQVRITITTSPTITVSIVVTADGSTVTADSPGVYWVNAGASLVIRVPTEASSSGQSYVFERWAGGGPTSATLTIPAVAPMTLTAQYRATSIFESPAFWIGIIGAIVGAILLAFLFLRKRKREPEEPTPPQVAGVAGVPPPPAAEAPGEGTMECPSCGMTVPAVAGPCPVCGTEVAPPEAPAKDERVVKLEDAYKSGRISKEQYQANLRRIRGNA